MKNEDNKNRQSQHTAEYVDCEILVGGATNVALSSLAEGNVIFTMYIKSTTGK